MGIPPPVDAPVLSTADRRDLQRRLDRALDALADLAERMSRGERGPEEMAEHKRLIAQVEELSAILARAADFASLDEDPRIVEDTEDGQVVTCALVHPVEARPADGASPSPQRWGGRCSARGRPTG